MAVQLTAKFSLGTLVMLSATFTRPPTDEEIDDGTAVDADDWQPVDPTTVTAKVKDPSGTITEHAYADSPADIIREDVGVYRLDITPDAAGTWYFRFASTGDGQAAGEHNFVIATSAFT